MVISVVQLSKSKVVLSLFLWGLLIGFILLLPWIPLTVEKEISASFLDDITSSKAIVFFGFQGCDSTCPTTLMVLANLLEGETKLAENPQVIFIDVDSNSSGDAADSFAKMFHQSFIGYHPTKNELNTLIAQFGLNVKQKGSQISHQGRTYQLQKEGEKWLLTKVYNPDTFSAETLVVNLN